MTGHIFQDNSGNASVGRLFLKVFLCSTKLFRGCIVSDISTGT